MTTHHMSLCVLLCNNIYYQGKQLHQIMAIASVMDIDLKLNFCVKQSCVCVGGGGGGGERGEREE